MSRKTSTLNYNDDLSNSSLDTSPYNSKMILPRPRLTAATIDSSEYAPRLLSAGHSKKQHIQIDTLE